MPFGRITVFGAVAGRSNANTYINGADLDGILYAPALCTAIFGFNLTSSFEHRLEPTIGALQRLTGWTADGTIAGPPNQTSSLAEAAEAHRLSETGESTGQLTLKPRPGRGCWRWGGASRLRERRRDAGRCPDSPGPARRW